MGIEDSLRQADRIGPGASFPLHEDRQLSSAHSLHEDFVIAFTLIGIIDGEVRLSCMRMAPVPTSLNGYQ